MNDICYGNESKVQFLRNLVAMRVQEKGIDDILTISLDMKQIQDC